MAIIPKIRLKLFKTAKAFTIWKLRNLYGMHIGKGVRINRKANIDHTVNPQGIYIGDFTGISDATIMAHDGVKLTKADTIIGKRCHIGYAAFINSGMRIGNGATIAAGAVVIKNVPPYAIVFGSPAKIHRFRFDQEVIDKLNNSHYWENEPKEAKKIIGEIGLI